MQDSLYYIIDIDTIDKNIKSLKNKTSINHNSVMDACNSFYGFGLEMISILEKNDVNYIIVNDLDEALEVRKYNTKIGIIIKNLNFEYLDDAIVNNLIIVIYNNKQLEEIDAKKLRDEIKVILFVDCGDNTFGFKTIKKVCDYEEENKYFNIVGIMSEYLFNRKKSFAETFFNLCNKVKHDLIRINMSESQFNNVDFFDKNVYIKNVSLNATIKSVKKIDKGTYFFNKIMRKEKNFSIINMPYLMDFKKVLIKDKLYKVYANNNSFIIVEVDKEVSAKDKITFQEFGNDIVLLNNIKKLYLKGNKIVESHYI